MCGITGYIDFKNRPIDKDLLTRMTRVLAHRGPDDEGMYISSPASRRDSAQAGLGHRRLSIIDLSPAGHQPMPNEDRTVWIVLNGEIYNFPELRELCCHKGHTFRSHTDTEVIVHLYEEYGVEALQHLKGMFSFAIWDENKQRVFMARDRLGQKPLYYYRKDGRLLFASEIKSILEDPSIVRAINTEALDDYMTYEYVPSPQTMFKDIMQVPPAHFVVADKNGRRCERYWHLSFADKLICSEQEYSAGIMERLREATKMRLMSDVPLGAFLSGGIDSSAIVGIMSSLMDRPVKTFSIGFEEDAYNELNYAQMIADRFKTEHHTYIVKPNIREILPKLIWHYNQPYADSSAIPTYYLSQMTRQEVTVALNGDAGDENFAGYERYVANRLADMYQKIPGFLRTQLIQPLAQRLGGATEAKTVLHRLKRFILGASESPRLRHYYWMLTFNKELKQTMYSADLAEQLRKRDEKTYLMSWFDKADGQDFIDQVLFVDLMSYLPEDLLVKVDVASMAHGLEARSPFLDHELVEYAARIPAKMKLRGRTTKYVLKRTFRELLPQEILHRPKMGFGVPIGAWFRGELKDFVQEIFNDSQLARAGYFHKEALTGLVNDHVAGRANHSARVWALLNLELWYRMFITRTDPVPSFDDTVHRVPGGIV